MAGTELNGIGIDIENKSFEVSASSSQLDSWSLGCDITIEDMDADIQEIRVNDITMSGNITTEEISVDIESTEVKAMDLAVGFVFGSLGSSLGGNVVDGLDDIKDSIADINDAIQDISKESANIKVTINGIQSQVNDIGTELTNKASVETVVEIGEQITEVQTNVAEQTIRVNSLEAEISTKASAESVTQIADELAITNESLAEQVIKVTDLTAEVSTKASSEMVTEISDNLKITNDTLAEQTLKVDALSSEISTKASAESVADIAGELAITNKSVAEQTIKVSALESEIATKASSESVLTLEGDVVAVEKAVAEQTIKVEGLEASIESKVSKEEFNEKTGELDTKYTNLKQTADNLTIEVGEQGESLTKVVADVNGLSVRVDDIGEAQANYDNTLSELTDILTPEQMSTQIGKGVVLSTVIATRDTDGNITAGMNASSVHSDPVHGRVVFAGGVKNKTDWTKATGILYEDGHIVMNSGEFGENVKIGNAMFRAVLEGDFDLFSYPENGTLVPLFQVNKDSSGKIVSISTPYDFTVNRNLVVFGDASSGDGGGGSSSVGIQGIVVNGTTYRDTDGDGLIDLGTIGGGTLTEITYEMIVGALGYTPVSSASLGSLAYKNGLTASEVGALSTSGGTIDSTSDVPLTIDGEGSTVRLRFSKAGTMLGYFAFAEVNTPLYMSTSGNPFKLIHSGNIEDYALPKTGGTIENVTGTYTPLFIKTTDPESWIGFTDNVGTYYIGTYRGVPSVYKSGVGTHTLYHTGNFNPANYLPLSGGTISGDLVVTGRVYEKALMAFTAPDGTTNAYLANELYGNIGNGRNLAIFNAPANVWYTLIHSGNIGSYNAGSATKDGNGNIITSTYLPLFGGTIKGSSTSTPLFIVGNSTQVRLALGYGDSPLFAYLVYKGGFNWCVTSESYAGEKTLAFTDSNVASAQALAHSNGTVGATAESSGRITFASNVTLGLDKSILDPSGRSIFMLDGNNSPQIGFDTVGSYSTYINGKDVYLRYGSSRTAGLILNSSGNVTIGNTDKAGASDKLYVDGHMVASWLYFKEADGTYSSYVGRGGSNSDIYLYSKAALKMYAGSSAAMLINSSGNVTIGSQDLLGDTTLTKFYVDGGMGAKRDLGGNIGDYINLQHYAQFEISRKSNAMCVSIAISDDDYGIIQSKGMGITSTGRLAINPNGGNVYIGAQSWGSFNPTMTVSDNVLIGKITDNGAKLQVEGDIHLGIARLCSIGTPYSVSDPTMYNRISIGSAYDGIKYYSGSWTGGVDNISHEFIVGGENKSALAITNGGNVLIGTTTDNGSDAKLQVNGAAAATLFRFVNNDGTTGSYIGRPSTGNDDILLKIPTANDFYIATNGTERMRITRDGNVGIGTAYPQAKLDVAGNTTINGNLVVAGDISA